MRIDRARQVLTSLRDGLDPTTGGRLPAGAPCQEPDVVRALYTVLAALPAADAAGEGEASMRRPAPPRAGLPWGDEEDARLGTAFDEGSSVPKLAEALGRTASAVRLRLVKLGRLAAEDVLPRRHRAEPASAPEPVA